MQLYNIAVVEDVVSFYHYPIVLSWAPNSGILQLGSEIFVEVKAVADYITLDVDHSGLAAAINRFLV